MSLLKLTKIKVSDVDPVLEVKQALNHFELTPMVQDVLLFGSAAKGEMSVHSDIDVLVVLKEGFTAKQAQRKLCKRPLSEWPMDWIFKTPAEFGERSKVGGVCFDALHHGVRVL